MSVTLDAKYVQDWTVVGVPAGGGSPTFKVDTILTFRASEVQAFSDPKTGLGAPGTYASVTEILGTFTVQAPFSGRNMIFVLNGDGSGTVEDQTNPKTRQTIKAATPPTSNTTPPGGSDITGLVVFLALIIGFVVFLK